MLGAAVGAMFGAACLAAMVADIREPVRRGALPLRPAKVGGGPEASSDPSAAASSVRSFLLLERAGLHDQMTDFVTDGAREQWFRPDDWRGAGRLTSFDLLISEAESSAVAWRVPAMETHVRDADRRLTRRFVYRVVARDGVWLIDDYEVGPAEKPKKR